MVNSAGKRLFSVALALFMAAAAQGAERVSNTLKVGDAAPDFTLSDISGEPVRLSAYRKKNVVFLNFWATWCEACKEEIPLLKKVHSDHKDKGLVVLGVDVGEEQGKVASKVAKRGIDYPVVLDPESATFKKAYGLVGLPCSLIIDKQGIIRYMGFRPPEDIKGALAPLLSGRPKRARAAE